MTTDTGNIPSYLHYYRVLGLQPGAGLQEIKHAYRMLAKKLHPDVSKAPDARERFIELNEAYEFLIRLKERKVSAPAAAHTPGRRHSRSRHGYRADEDYGEELFREWMRKERQKARARAASEARKKYYEFKKSTIYKTSQVISAAYDYIFVALGLLIITGSIVGFFTQPHETTILSNTYPYRQEEHSMVKDILLTLFLIFIGGIFIFFAGMNILDRRGEK